MWYSANLKALLDLLSPESGQTAPFLVLGALFGAEISTITKEGMDSEREKEAVTMVVSE